MHQLVLPKKGGSTGSETVGGNKCKKHRFPYALSMIFDRLSRHLGFSNLARLFSRVSNLGLLYLWNQRV